MNAMRAKESLRNLKDLFRRANGIFNQIYLVPTKNNDSNVPQGPFPNSTPATLTHASYSEYPPPSPLISHEILAPHEYCPARAFHIVDVHAGQSQ